MFPTSNHMAATHGGGIGERRVFILYWSNLSAALQLVLVHAIDVLLGFHLVGGDGQSSAIISSFGRYVTLCWPALSEKSPWACSNLSSKPEPAQKSGKSTEGCSKVIYATYVQQKRVVAVPATTRLSHIQPKAGNYFLMPRPRRSATDATALSSTEPQLTQPS